MTLTEFKTWLPEYLDQSIKLLGHLDEHCVRAIKKMLATVTEDFVNYAIQYQGGAAENQADTNRQIVITRLLTGEARAPENSHSVSMW